MNRFIHNYHPLSSNMSFTLDYRVQKISIQQFAAYVAYKIVEHPDFNATSF
jgi:hypothetical protein